MKLSGSCHCGAIKFSLEAREPVPYLRCYCSICRKTAGSGGFGVNIGADSSSLVIEGKKHVSRYDPATGETGNEPLGLAGRRFCRNCGSPLWNYDPRWPELVHPHAGAIDDDLPVPPERTHMMLASAANWVEPDFRDGDKRFDEYPDESLKAWHDRVLKRKDE